MAGLARTGFSIDPDLLKRFDRAISGKGYQNRSEAVRDLMRDYLVSEEADKNKVVAGTLTFVYDHHRPNLTEKLVEAQHQAGSQVLAATHVHLDHHNCLEVVMMKGRSGAIRDLSNRILSLQGVKHGQLVITSTGKDLKEVARGVAGGRIDGLVGCRVKPESKSAATTRAACGSC
jgi:CopG family transcriptional regulator, nickel-responsive regulator